MHSIPRLEGLEHKKSGKVRELYQVDGDHLLLVASDRISAYDSILPTPIPDKGRVLTQLSAWWFERLLGEGDHHLVTADLDEMPPAVQAHRRILAGRTMLVLATTVEPVECVVRGYLAGSGWKEYRASSSVCGIELPTGLNESEALPEPIFTPATKAESGHDENITFERMCDIVGTETAEEMRRRSLDLYHRAAQHARRQGIIIADTKIEFGRRADGKLLVIDEIFTPDSSRFWPAQGYRPGRSQPSFDKQFVRDYLDSIGWSHEPPAPELPPEIAEGTRERYLSAYALLVGKPLVDSSAG